jgi:hypothetical protein
MSRICPELEFCVRRAVVNTLHHAIRECEACPDNAEIKFKKQGYQEALVVARARLAAFEGQYPHVRGC